MLRAANIFSWQITTNTEDLIPLDTPDSTKRRTPTKAENYVFKRYSSSPNQRRDNDRAISCRERT